MAEVQDKYFLMSVQLAKESIRLGPSAIKKVEALLAQYAQRSGASNLLLELWTGYAAELPQLKGVKKLDSRDTVSVVLKEKFADREALSEEILGKDGE